MLLVEDCPGRVPLPEDVAVPPVAEVEVVGVRTVEAPHQIGERICRAVQEEVVVRPHQAVGEAIQPEADVQPPKQAEKDAAIDVVLEEQPVVHGPGRHMEHPVWEGTPRHSRHGCRR